MDRHDQGGEAALVGGADDHGPVRGGDLQQDVGADARVERRQEDRRVEGDAHGWPGAEGSRCGGDRAPEGDGEPLPVGPQGDGPVVRVGDERRAQGGPVRDDPVARGRQAVQDQPVVGEGPVDGHQVAYLAGCAVEPYAFSVHLDPEVRQPYGPGREVPHLRRAEQEPARLPSTEAEEGRRARTASR